MSGPAASNRKPGNDLHQRQLGVAAHWLQFPGNDGHSSAPNGTDWQGCDCESDAAIEQIARAWPYLQPHIRHAVLTPIDAALVQQCVDGGGSHER